MTILELLKLSKTESEVEFLNIEVEEDNKFYFDPYLIGQMRDSISKQMHETASSFFAGLINFILGKERLQAVDYVSKCEELNAYRLGMSAGHPQGKGMGDGNAEAIVAAIENSKAVRFLEGIEDLSVFLKYIGHDKVSDMYGRVVLNHMSDFTGEMCDKYSIECKVDKATGYNIRTGCFESLDVNFAYIGGRKILLVPKQTVSRRPRYSASEFLNAIIEHQKDYYVANRSTEIVYRNGSPTKKSIKAVLTKNGRRLDKDFIVEYLIENENFSRPIYLKKSEQSRIVRVAKKRMGK